MIELLVEKMPNDIADQIVEVGIYTEFSYALYNA